MRLFVALAPDPGRREAIASWARGAGANLRGARWQPAGNLHLTLRFLGEVDAGAVPPLALALAAAVAGHPPSRLLLGAPIALPRGRPRVAGLEVVAGPALETLRSAVASTAERVLGIPPESRPFRPHLTLARARRPWTRSAGDQWRAHPCPFQGDAFEITYVDLMESRLSPSGARYRAVERFPLGG